MLGCKKRKVVKLAYFLPCTQVAFGNIVHADLVFQAACVFVFMTGNADGDNVGVGGVMQNSVGVMHRAVYGIAVDVFIQRFVFGVAVFHIAV